ncbi:MAG: ankyrin repeat domain-containing protein [Rickettsia sp.]|nr:ankyrin repeat domain-containing protein [Rickettsia sp.]
MERRKNHYFTHYKYNVIKILKYSISNRMNINQNTELMFVTYYNFLDIVQMLIDGKANLNLQDDAVEKAL